MFRSFLNLSLLTGIILYVGCTGGAPDAPKMATVTVAVTVDGKPIAGEGVQVVFQPSGKGAPQPIALKADGTGKGTVVAGNNKIRLVVSGGAPSATPGQAHGESNSKGVGKQFQGDDSPLTADAKDGATFKFEVGGAAAPGK